MGLIRKRGVEGERTSRRDPELSRTESKKLDCSSLVMMQHADREVR